MTNVKSYTSKQLLDRIRTLPSFKYMPRGIHVVVVRSKEDAPDKYDDKLYLFLGKKFLFVMGCTANSGSYGLKNFFKWNKKGAAVIKFDEIYYNAFAKSDGKYVRHHNGKMQCLRQIAPMKYYRDGNKDLKTDEVGEVFEANNSTNVHGNSYKYKTGIRSYLVGRWGTGCTVVQNLTEYYNELLANVDYNQPVTYTGLKEF